MVSVKQCDRCGGIPAYRVYLRIVKSRKNVEHKVLGDLCDKCIENISSDYLKGK